MITSQTNPLVECKQIILNLKELEVPDGRPLYKYRLTQVEFESLESLLRNYITDRQQRFGLEWIFTRPTFPDLFVLYCSQWWQRRYAGKGFKWEPIFSDLGISADTLTPQQRSECVVEGLRGWGLSISRTGGHTYIGSVASQGGLPTKLLGDPRAKIGHLISSILRIAKSTQVSFPDLSGWAESLKHLLPKSFRQPAVFTLIADIAWTVLRLKEEASLNAQSNPIERLDQAIPGWKDRFPLAIESQHAVRLIEHLVREVARIRPDRQGLILPLLRTIEFDGDVVRLRSEISVPEVVDEKALVKLFEIGDQDLPRSANLTIYAGEVSTTVSMRRVTGRNSYRATISPVDFSGTIAAREHLLQFGSPDSRVWNASPRRAEALDGDLPWIFADEAAQFEFLRQGGGSVAPQCAFVAVPENWKVSSANPTSEATLVGTLDQFERQVFSIRGLFVLEDGNGNKFRIQTGSSQENGESFEWIGNRLWYDLQRPPSAYRGMPALYLVDDDGNKRSVDGSLRCTSIGIGEPATYGPLEVRFPANGELKYRSRMLVLPETSSIRFEPIDARSGRIIFEGWRASSIIVSNQHVEAQLDRTFETATLTVSVARSERTPELIDLDIYWQGTLMPAKLRVPFPAYGVRGFDRNKRELPQFSHLAVQDLLGSRLSVVGLQPGTRVILKLKAADIGISRKYEIRTLPGALTTEIRIADYRRDIDHLLTIDDNPDSTAVLTVEINGEPKYQMTFLPYQARPERDETKLWIESDPRLLSQFNHSEVNALAIALERPGEEAIPLDKPGGDRGDNIVWNFFPDEREAGAWLIYPAKDSAIQFRPMLWSVGESYESEDPFVQAITIRERTKREEALDAFIDSIASDFEHSGWIAINQLASQVGHLPLSTVDVWRRFARSSKAMAAMAMRFNEFQGDFLARFDDELPFAWETISFDDWKTAVGKLYLQVGKLFPEETSEILFKSFLKSRVNDIAADHGALFYLFGTIQADFFEEERQDAILVRNCLGKIAETRLFDGADSYLNKLRTRQGVDDVWPDSLSDITAPAMADSSISKYLCTRELGNNGQISVVNLPLLLAAQVGTGKTQEWFSNTLLLSRLSEYKAFDPDWFDDAFNETIARCLADGLLDRNI